MKNKFLAIIGLICIIQAQTAAAHSGSETSSNSKSLKVRSQGKDCKYLGVKGVREYLTTKNLVCLRSKHEGEKKGYSDAYLNSFKTEELHSIQFDVQASQAVPPTSSVATGDCTGVMNHNTLKFRVVCTHNIPNFTAGHLHMGIVGQKGPMICASPSLSSPIAFDCQLDAVSHAALHAGELYINLHSSDFVEGELRGQI